MHSTIGAISTGVPVIPIAYSRKFNGLYDTLGYPYYVDAKSGIKFDQAIEETLDFVNRREELQNAALKCRPVYEERLAAFVKSMSMTLSEI